MEVSVGERHRAAGGPRGGGNADEAPEDKDPARLSLNHAHILARLAGEEPIAEVVCLVKVEALQLTLPLQSGVHSHWPSGPQVPFSVQLPQEPPQPSSPQVLPSQSGMHTHCPSPVQASLAPHAPQARYPSHPSSITPQTTWPQLSMGAQSKTQSPPTQLEPGAQVPADAAAAVIAAHGALALRGADTLAASALGARVTVSAQEPPQPSSPQALPSEQLGVQGPASWQARVSSVHALWPSPSQFKRFRVAAKTSSLAIAS